MNPFSLMMSFGIGLMEKIPSYDQTKKQKAVNLQKAYIREWAKGYPERDDDLILNLKEEIEIFMTAFYREINK